MKLLFESFRKFLTENPSVYWKRLHSFFGFSHEKIQHLVANIPSLQDISKYLGQGQNGIVFQLKNDHILKVSYKEKQFERYKQIQTRQFQGKSNRNEPAINNFGKVELEDQTGDMFEIMWVEMGKVIPMEQWIELTGRDSKAVARGLRKFDRIFHSRTSLNDILAYLKKSEHGEYQAILQSGLTKKEIIEIIKMLYRHSKTSRDTFDDFHIGNFGVIPGQGKMLDTFVYFDT